ncbi:MAG TPA: hypothetical protein VF613_02225 [Longimicrobium sp.]
MTAREKAQQGLALLKEAVLEELGQSHEGLVNAEVADALEIRSDYQGKQKDYLSWSVLGLLLNEGKIKREGRRYLLP